MLGGEGGSGDGDETAIRKASSAKQWEGDAVGCVVVWLMYSKQQL